MVGKGFFWILWAVLPNNQTHRGHGNSQFTASRSEVLAGVGMGGRLAGWVSPNLWAWRSVPRLSCVGDSHIWCQEWSSESRGPAGTGACSETGVAGPWGAGPCLCCGLGAAGLCLFKCCPPGCVPSGEIRSACSRHTPGCSFTVPMLNAQILATDELAVGTTALYQGCFLSQFGGSRL